MANLRKFCDEELPGRSAIEVVDVLARPDLARAENIVAVPMLVRIASERTRIAIGDLSNTTKILAALNVHGPALVERKKQGL